MASLGTDLKRIEKNLKMPVFYEQHALDKIVRDQVKEFKRRMGLTWIGGRTLKEVTMNWKKPSLA